MEYEFWDGFDSGYSYGFDDGMKMAIKRLLALNKKKVIISVVASSIIASGATIFITHLINKSRNKKKIKA